MTRAEQVILDGRPPEVIIRDMLTIDRAIDDYLDDLRRRRYSERTIQTYRRILDELAERLPHAIDVSKVIEDDVRRMLGAKAVNKKTGQPNATGTIAHAEKVMSSFFIWLYKERKIARNPMDRMQRTRTLPAEDLDVITVATGDVPKLFAAAEHGTELNTVAAGAYLGARRGALARLRETDYDQEHRTLAFREKGSKTIVKPVPHELAVILDASIGRGEILPAPFDYLIPPEGPLQRKGDRDDRVIWRVVRRVAKRAGVNAHVHSLRAAFACFYLERNPDDLLGLKELLGHRSIATTLVYLRRLNKLVAMEKVRDLSWASVGDPAWLSQSPPTWLAASGSMGAGGFEPPLPDNPDGDSDSRQPGEARLDEVVASALGLTAAEAREFIARQVGGSR